MLPRFTDRTRVVRQESEFHPARHSFPDGNQLGSFARDPAPLRPGLFIGTIPFDQRALSRRTCGVRTPIAQRALVTENFAPSFEESLDEGCKRTASIAFTAGGLTNRRPTGDFDFPVAGFPPGENCHGPAGSRNLAREKLFHRCISACTARRRKRRAPRYAFNKRTDRGIAGKSISARKTAHLEESGGGRAGLVYVIPRPRRKGEVRGAEEGHGPGRK